MPSEVKEAISITAVLFQIGFDAQIALRKLIIVIEKKIRPLR